MYRSSVALGVEGADDQCRAPDALRERDRQQRTGRIAGCAGLGRLPKTLLRGWTQAPTVRQVICAIDGGLAALVRFAPSGHAKHLRRGRSGGAGARRRRNRVGLVMAMPPDAEEALLQIAIGMRARLPP